MPVALDSVCLFAFWKDGKATPDILNQYSERIQMVPEHTPVVVIDEGDDPYRYLQIKVTGGEHRGLRGYVYPEWVH